MRGEARRTSGSIRRSWGRWAVPAALAAFAAVVLIAPSVAAGPTNGIVHITRITAPYAATRASYATGVSTSGCASAGVTTMPFFTATTGAAGFATRAHERSCQSPLQGYIDASAVVAVTMKLPTIAGQSKVVAKWDLSISGSNSVGIGSCPAGSVNYSYCDVFAESYISGYAYVEDLTNQSSTFASNYWSGYFNVSEIFDYCYLGNCSSSVNGAGGAFSAHQSVTWYFNTTGFVSGHRYVLVMVLEGASYAEVLTYGSAIVGGRATAALDLATGGSGATLSSVTIR